MLELEFGPLGAWWQLLLGDLLDGPGHLLADDRAHARAHEAEVSHGDAQRHRFDQAGPADDRLRQAGFALAVNQLLVVALAGTHEIERIARSKAAIFLTERALIQQLCEP